MNKPDTNKVLVVLCCIVLLWSTCMNIALRAQLEAIQAQQNSSQSE